MGVVEVLAVWATGWIVGVACAVIYLAMYERTPQGSPPAPAKSMYALTKKSSQSRPRVIVKSEEKEAEIEEMRANGEL